MKTSVQAQILVEIDKDFKKLEKKINKIYEIAEDDQK